MFLSRLLLFYKTYGELQSLFVLFQRLWKHNLHKNLIVRIFNVNLIAPTMLLKRRTSILCKARVSYKEVLVSHNTPFF